MDNQWTRAISDWIHCDVKRNAGRAPIWLSEFFTKSLENRYDTRRILRANRTRWATFTRDREWWKIYWDPLESLDDLQDYRWCMWFPNTLNSLRLPLISSVMFVIDIVRSGFLLTSVGKFWSFFHCLSVIRVCVVSYDRVSFPSTVFLATLTIFLEHLLWQFHLSFSFLGFIYFLCLFCLHLYKYIYISF